MGKKIKKGTKGEVTQFMTRSKAIRKLQLTLKDFRRLCILKGIYPREPKKKFKGNTTTYYHVKDINFLAHERILGKFREIQAHMKRHRKALRRGELLKAKNMNDNRPVYTLNHLIKERYPSFIDALRDLDDPLCLLNLFALFPSHKDFTIPNDRVQTCMRLAREFNLFVIQNQSLRKVFLSIKGIYYQVEVLGQTITWITPYQFPQNMPQDVDYKVMLTFLEFYETLMKFVNFKLFSNLNLKYPPFEAQSDSLEQEQYWSYKTYKMELAKQGSEIQAQEDAKYQISKQFEETSEEVKQLLNNADFEGKNLFKGLTFFLNREVPRSSLEFVILSFGGEVHWEDDGSGIAEDSPKITHFVTDRDPKTLKVLKHREYVQPQWAYDCINHGILLSVKEYAPGKLLPPHLSPFVVGGEEEHVPERQKQIDKLKSKENPAVHDEGHKSNEEEEAGESETEREAYDHEKEVVQKKKKEKLQEKEEKNLAKTMLTKKQKRIMSQIDYGNEKRKAEKSKLEEKARKIKSEKKKASIK